MVIKLLQLLNNLELISSFHPHQVVEPKSSGEQKASKLCSLLVPYFEIQMLLLEFHWKNKFIRESKISEFPVVRVNITECSRTYLKWSLTTRLIKPSISRIYGLDFFPWYSAIEKSSLCIVKIIASIESETDENNGKSIEPVNSSFFAFKNHENSWLYRGIHIRLCHPKGSTDQNR